MPAPGGARSRGWLEGYTFVDYATQIYQLAVIALVVGFHNNTVAHWPRHVWAHVVAIALVHWLVRKVRNGAGPVLDFLRHFYPVLFYTWFFTETGYLNRMFVPDYLDAEVIRLEQIVFRSQPAILFMANLPYLLVSELFYAAYFSYYIMIVGVGLALYLRNRSQFFHYVSVVSFVFYVCYLIYIFLPVIGPKVFIDEGGGFTLSDDLRQLAPEAFFPLNIQVGPFYQIINWIYRTFEPAGAAMPSSHVAVAITTVYFSFSYLRRIRYTHLVAAILLCASTVYCRYHYVLDVLAGAALAGVLIPFGNWLYWRYAARASLNRDPV